jgi:hypothetical protein
MQRHRKKPPRIITPRMLKQADLPLVPVRTSDAPLSSGQPADRPPSGQAEPEPLDDAIRRMIEAAYT